jgi:hypothetical protein
MSAIFILNRFCWLLLFRISTSFCNTVMPHGSLGGGPLAIYNLVECDLIAHGGVRTSTYKRNYFAHIKVLVVAFILLYAIL